MRKEHIKKEGGFEGEKDKEFLFNRKLYSKREEASKPRGFKLGHLTLHTRVLRGGVVMNNHMGP